MTDFAVQYVNDVPCHYPVGGDMLNDSELDLLLPIGEKPEWIVYDYTIGDYEGYGQLVMWDDFRSQLWVRGLDHCSCFGPLEGGNSELLAVDPIDLFSADVHACSIDDVLVTYVKELLSGGRPDSDVWFD